MNMQEFSNEVRSIRSDFTETLDQIYREMVEHSKAAVERLDIAHSVAQERFHKATAALMGVPMPEDPQEAYDAPVTTSHRVYR